VKNVSQVKYKTSPSAKVVSLSKILLSYFKCKERISPLADRVKVNDCTFTARFTYQSAKVIPVRVDPVENDSMAKYPSFISSGERSLSVVLSTIHATTNQEGIFITSVSNKCGVG